MSSLVIGLDIDGTHITAALIRINQSSTSNLSIERDTFHTRFCETNTIKNPRSIISTWIECINDLLHDFANNYTEDDTIVGISCGIPGPMDYEQGICYIQSSTINKFDKCFGLNLRLLLEYGLTDLLSRWKHDYYAKYYTPPTSPRSSVSYSKKQESTPHRSVGFTIVPTITNVEIHEEDLSIKNLTNYCGSHYDTENSRIHTSISKSPREPYFHDNKFKSLTTDHFSSKLWSTIEQLSSIPISFYNDATCFAVGEATSIYNKDYERILALTLGTGFGSTFIDRGEIISNRSDVPSGGVLWNCPYDDNSIADDWFSTRGLVNIYKKILQENRV